MAQKINLDSLIHVAVSLGDKMRNIPLPNRDSLLKLLPATSSPAARIKLIYDIIENYGQLDKNREFYYNNKILENTSAANDKIGQAVILSELGADIFSDGDNNGGLQMIFKGLNIAEQTGNNQATGIVYDNLAMCYPNNVPLKKFYLQKAIILSGEGKDTAFLVYELGNLSNVYRTEKKMDSAIYYLSKSFELAIKKNLTQALPYTIILLGSLQNKVSIELEFYRAALNMPYTLRDTATWCTALERIASFYKEHGKIDSGLFYAKKAYGFLNKIPLSLKIQPAYLLAQLYRKKNADSALKYTEIYYSRRDSMYSINKIEQAQALAFTDQKRQREMEEQKAAYQTSLRLYTFLAVAAMLLLLAFNFWKNNRQNKKSNLLLTSQKEQIQNTLNDLKSAQTQLIQAEKMASLGALTAGIAHEIQNPLNFVNNFSEVNKEMLEELKAESEKPKAARDEQLEIELFNSLIENEQKISHHGKRADSIVKGMLEHSRAGTGEKQPTDLNALADEFLKLAYHNLQARDKTFKAELITNYDEKLPKANVVQQDMGRVLLNLFNNAFYAVGQRQKTAGNGYKPTIEVTSFFLPLKGVGGLKVRDNGNGIPDAIKDKIMQPFFTTKPTGEGTGLGLSLSYDIVVKGHGGTIQVNSIEGEGSEFIIQLIG